MKGPSKRPMRCNAVPCIFYTVFPWVPFKISGGRHVARISSRRGSTWRGPKVPATKNRKLLGLGPLFLGPGQSFFFIFLFSAQGGSMAHLALSLATSLLGGGGGWAKRCLSPSYVAGGGQMPLLPPPLPFRGPCTTYTHTVQSLLCIQFARTH